MKATTASIKFRRCPEIAAAQKALNAAHARLQECVNAYLSSAIVPVLIDTRRENNETGEDLLQADTTWFLVRLNAGVDDLAPYFAPGDHTIATNDPEEPTNLVAYSVRQGFDIVVQRDQVEAVSV